MNNTQLLIEAKALIADPKTWCQRARARSSDNREVNTLSPSAVSFCSKGAILRALGTEKVDITELEAFLVKGNATPGNPAGINYIGFNDTKTHAEVMAMWDNAIKLSAV